MNVGEDKGRIVTQLIQDTKPQVMVELGGYIGYSTILFGDAVRKAGGAKFFSLERNPEFAAVIMALVDLAGLSDIVHVVIGPSDEGIKRLHSESRLKHIDLMFLDHYKPAYTSDLKLCESLKLVTPGTVLAADNVIKPGNPPYLDYVRSSVEDKRKRYGEGAVDGEQAAGFGDRWKNQYHNRVGEEKLNDHELGNPNLIYESRLVNSFEPTGIPVSYASQSMCVSFADICRMESRLLDVRERILYHEEARNVSSSKAVRWDLWSIDLETFKVDVIDSRRTSFTIHQGDSGSATRGETACVY